MCTVTVRELLEAYKPEAIVNMTIISGYGNGYSEAQQLRVTQHLLDIVEDVQRINPAVILHLVPMNPVDLSYAEIEEKTTAHIITSNIVLIVGPDRAYVSKCGGRREYRGRSLANLW